MVPAHVTDRVTFDKKGLYDSLTMRGFQGKRSGGQSTHEASYQQLQV